MVRKKVRQRQRWREEVGRRSVVTRIERRLHKHPCTCPSQTSSRCLWADIIAIPSLPSITPTTPPSTPVSTRYARSHRSKRGWECSAMRVKTFSHQEQRQERKKNEWQNCIPRPQAYCIFASRPPVLPSLLDGFFFSAPSKVNYLFIKLMHV